MSDNSSSTKYVSHDVNGNITLHSPNKIPYASGFLWNQDMLLHMTCRGYANGQFMQPEPAKYSHAPAMEAQSFMQPEPYYYAHHPARFIYIKDEDTQKVFSVPYDPTRNELDVFNFTVALDHLTWRIESLGIQINSTVSLASSDAVELWSIEVVNLTDKKRNISIYPYFTVGYMSWMNQSATFVPHLNAIVANSVTPYQKVDDYPKQKSFKDQTYLLADTVPDSWCANQQMFEGEGGLHRPDAVLTEYLPQAESRYDVPVAVMQYRLVLEAGQSKSFKFLFGPAKDHDEILMLKSKYLGLKESYNLYQQAYKAYLYKGKGCLEIESPDNTFNHFVNHWLPRQVYYQGDVHRLTTDPQTRNYLQDTMGMCFINHDQARKAFIKALSQQSITGAMPDGILLHPEAELKYINQVPHTDHAVWLSICLGVYINETHDLTLLDECVGFVDSDESLPVKQHISLALTWLCTNRNEQGLSYIEQGDWCDPMNMVGHKGKGVSAWLTMATAYSIKVWLELLTTYGITSSDGEEQAFSQTLKELNSVINQHFWDKTWYARGITDDGVHFGICDDDEGRIYLNPQSWSMLCGAADNSKIQLMLAEIDAHLSTPFGTMMLAPSYTEMREDVGRLTQKHPGVAENGSVYNHAAIFYAYSLLDMGEGDIAYKVLRMMLPDDDDALKRGQLANFIPNYYRGAYHQFPSQAGRSSQLFNTGTVAWYYRCVIEEICGLKGCNEGLRISPKLPATWPYLHAKRIFQGATFHVHIVQNTHIKQVKILVDGIKVDAGIITNIIKGKHYHIDVSVPLSA